MSVRVRSQVVVVASLDDDEKQVHFERQDKSLTSTVVDYDVEESGQLALAASEADFPLPLGKVATGSVIYLESDQELEVKFDGEVAGHKVKPTTAVKGKLYLNGEFSAVTLSNNAAVEANVSFFVAGSKT